MRQRTTERAPLDFLDTPEVTVTKEKCVTVYSYLGKYAMYDHIRVERPEADPRYVWHDQHFYDHLYQKAIENQCPQHLNMREVEDEVRAEHRKYAIGVEEPIQEVM